MVADILAKIRAAPAAHVPLASHLHGAPILPALPTLLRTVLKLGRAGETPATQRDASRSAIETRARRFALSGVKESEARHRPWRPSSTHRRYAEGASAAKACWRPAVCIQAVRRGARRRSSSIQNTLSRKLIAASPMPTKRTTTKPSPTTASHSNSILTTRSQAKGLKRLGLTR